jgi:hypothetical protein
MVGKPKPESFIKKWFVAGHWWLTPVILAPQEAQIRRITVQTQLGQTVPETHLEKLFIKIGLVEWLKVKALSSSPSTVKKKKGFQTSM